MSVSENHAVFGTLGYKVCAVRVLRPCVQAGRNSIKLVTSTYLNRNAGTVSLDCDRADPFIITSRLPAVERGVF